MQVLGYDVLFDETLRPWLVEVNHSPSFTTDTPLDLAIKTEVISEAMQLVRLELGCYAAFTNAERLGPGSLRNSASHPRSSYWLPAWPRA